MNGENMIDGLQSSLSLHHESNERHVFSPTSLWTLMHHNSQIFTLDSVVVKTQNLLS